MIAGTSLRWALSISLLALFSCQPSAPVEVPVGQVIVGKWRYERLVIPSSLAGLSHSGSGKQKLEFAIARSLELAQKEIKALQKERENLPVYRANMLKLQDFVASFRERNLTYRTKPDAPTDESLKKADLFEVFHLGAKQESSFDPGDWMKKLGDDVRAGRFALVLDEVQARQNYSDALQYSSPEGKKRLANDLASVRMMYKLIESDEYDRWHSRGVTKRANWNTLTPVTTSVERVVDPYVFHSPVGGEAQWWGTNITVDRTYVDDLKVLVAVEKEMRELSFVFSLDGTYTVEKKNTSPVIIQQGSYTLENPGTIVRRVTGEEASAGLQFIDNVRVLSNDSMVIGSDQIHVLYVRERP